MLMEMETTTTTNEAESGTGDRGTRKVKTHSLCILHIGRIRILQVLSLLPSTAELLIRECGSGLRVELGLLLGLRELLLLLENGWVKCGGTHGVLRETIGHIWE